MWGMRLVPVLAGIATLALNAAAHADNRVALIIGNSDYKNVRKLSNAVNDARAVKATLKAIGFKVVYGEDLGKRDMERAVGIFAKEANNADVALVYYSGHGSTFGEVPYMVPVDARYDSLEEVKHELVPVEEMVGELRRAKGVRLAVLDACRDNEAEQQLKAKTATRGFSEARGLARIGDPDGLIVAYSTQFLNTALDGNPGGNSPFTSALVKNLPTPGLDIKAMLFKTAQDVVQATGGNQRPEVQVSLYQDYSLVPTTAQAPAVAALPAPSAAVVAAPRLSATPAAQPQVRPFSIAPTVPEIAPQPTREQFAAETQRRNQQAAAQAAAEQAGRAAAAQREAQRIAALTTQQLLDLLARMQPEEARSLIARISPEQRAALEQAVAGEQAEVQQASVPEIEADAPQVRRASPPRTAAPRAAPRRSQPLLREAAFEEAPSFEPRRFERFEEPARLRREAGPRRFDGGARGDGFGRGDGLGGGRGGPRFQAQAGGFGGGRGRF